MEVLGDLPDIPTFDGEPVPVSQNPLTPGTRPLQLLPLPGTEFPVRYETSRMRGFQSKLRDTASEMCGASAEMRYAIVLLGFTDPPMRARVVAAGFGDYAVGLHRTQPRFPPAMRYALMERWNDCTHTFVFGFSEMTLTPVDYARYQTATLGAQLRYQEICQRFEFARSYIGWLYSERHELELENGRLRRHQSRQSSAVSRLQAEVERLQTKLEVEGIPLDSSEEDEDGSSSPTVSISGGCCWS
ncbi:hypothetical protein JCGZ_15274 [Jatropha curcas]|uniref:Aminotransferase-like plant mobile domain-containing protein n=1 Tax=Jatropha curcas TaxID=180498 RepID=A0A067K615_JATCU|nr:hypothetical protein JCGZ_15274 [Jatropha curcas]